MNQVSIQTLIIVSVVVVCYDALIAYSITIPGLHDKISMLWALAAAGIVTMLAIMGILLPYMYSSDETKNNSDEHYYSTFEN